MHGELQSAIHGLVSTASAGRAATGGRAHGADCAFGAYAARRRRAGRTRRLRLDLDSTLRRRRCPRRRRSLATSTRGATRSHLVHGSRVGRRDRWALARVRHVVAPWRRVPSETPARGRWRRAGGAPPTPTLHVHGSRAGATRPTGRSGLASPACSARGRGDSPRKTRPFPLWLQTKQFGWIRFGHLHDFGFRDAVRNESSV